jgi:hypothetical protein
MKLGWKSEALKTETRRNSRRTDERESRGRSSRRFHFERGKCIFISEGAQALPACLSDKRSVTVNGQEL